MVALQQQLASAGVVVTTAQLATMARLLSPGAKVVGRTDDDGLLVRTRRGYLIAILPDGQWAVPGETEATD
jgi:hypothetical protein